VSAQVSQQVSDLAARAAAVIGDGFERYHTEFLAITRRASRHFAARDWAGAQADSRARLDLYGQVLHDVLAALTPLLGPRRLDPTIWSAIRAEHARTVLGHPAGEIAETFYNSVTRRVFQTVGTNPAIEYLDYHFERVPGLWRDQPLRTFSAEPDLAAAVGTMLASYDLGVAFSDRAADARAVAAALTAEWDAGAAPYPLDTLEMLEPVFYRRKGAYLVGRARGGNRVMPLLLALVRHEDGVAVDAALLTEAEASVVFSFTRSYFLADVRSPAATIAFLQSLMPLKPVADLYAALGHHKHGKTEFYRALRRHLARTTEQFVRAPGARGMVMEVFVLPGFDAVFKVIRDRFPPPKQVTPSEVHRRYRMVFGHDRAGRLVDAQAYEGMAFPRDRFDPALLADLLAECAGEVRVEGDAVVIGELYAERRVRPLDLFLREAAPAAVLAAALDYGQTIRDLASTGIFPGDLLVKNFGVTRHGRVVFYDYDELRLLEECRFREVPEPRTPEDELADEPWYYVGPEDVFPEELGHFLPFQGAVRERYLAAHGALYAAAYWQDLQRREAAGEIVDIFPYAPERRLRTARST
jgi:isocitrate dehydrogenase kinase/phosphatase